MYKYIIQKLKNKIRIFLIMTYIIIILIYSDGYRYSQKIAKKTLVCYGNALQNGTCGDTLYMYSCYMNHIIIICKITFDLIV